MRKRWVVFVLALLLAGGGCSYYWHYKQQHAATPTGEKTTLVANYAGCYGGSCNGLDPSKYCTDGQTVASMDVKGHGLLELRYSPSCKANWGRYTAYTGWALGLAASSQTIYAKVTAWNPGGTSYMTAHDFSVPQTGSSWSQMVDGVVKACTGVEVVVVIQSGNDHEIKDRFPDGQPDFSGEAESQGWVWGPCR